MLDTETTGINRKKDHGGVAHGHRIIEVACLELINGKLTGKKFHSYVNPKCKIDKKATKIHGITKEFLEDKPTFKDIANDLIKFMENSTLIIHNAKFDIEFLDQEFNLLEPHQQPRCTFHVHDTLEMAREKFPNIKSDLNSLMKYFNININRDKHSAITDCEILNEIYNIMKL